MSASPTTVEAPTKTVEAAAKPAARRSDPFDDLWSLFSSPKLALFLILVIAAACLAGALITQAPGEMQNSSEGLRTWVERIRPKYGAWTDLFQTLGLFWVFQTTWFRALLGLLTINTLVCTLNRLPDILRHAFGAPIWPADGLYERGRPRASALLPEAPLEAATRPVRDALRRRGFRVVENAQDEATYLYADRFRLARLGTLLTHTALLLVFVAAVASGPLGFFEEPGFAVPIGSTREVGHGTGLAVRAEDFADEYHPDGRPKDYRSDLVVFKDGQEAAHQTVRVNEPLIYDEVRFHQAYFGQAAIVTVTDQAGTSLFRDAVSLTWRSNDGQRPVGYFALPGQDLHVYVVGPASGGDPLIRPGELLVEAYRGTNATTPTYRLTLTQGQPLAMASFQVQFERELPFTGLRVVHDPGANLIWVASTLLVLGLVVTFYFPHRRLWARIRRDEAGPRVVLVGAGKELAAELERLIGQLGGRPELEPESIRPSAAPGTAPPLATRRNGAHPASSPAGRNGTHAAAPTASQSAQGGSHGR